MPFKEISNLLNNEQISNPNSQVKIAEILSNESTPRIGEENIAINPLSGGYSIKKTFQEKNVNFKNKFK